MAKDPQDAVRALFDAPIEAEQFSDAFLNAVPLEQVRSLAAQISGLIGPVTDVDVDGTALLITTDSHTLSGTVTLDVEGRIAGLFFKPPDPLVVSFEAARDAMAALGHDVAWLVRRDGQVLTSERAGEQMYVGSAFKLGVLSVLVADIAAGARSWDDVVRLEAHHRSWPSGQLQDWPVGAPLTLHSAAGLMIAISDNTATDLLLETVGAARVADALGVEHVLSTAEYFALASDAALRAPWQTASGAEKAKLARAAGRRLSEMSMQALDQDAKDISWAMSLETLCDLIEPMGGLDVLSINPGPLVTSRWEAFAYKGGSLPGVLNFTAWMQDDDGRGYCAGLTVNHVAEVDLLAATAAFRGLISAARAAP